MNVKIGDLVWCKAFGSRENPSELMIEQCVVKDTISGVAVVSTLDGWVRKNPAWKGDTARLYARTPIDLFTTEDDARSFYLALWNASQIEKL